MLEAVQVHVGVIYVFYSWYLIYGSYTYKDNNMSLIPLRTHGFCFHSFGGTTLLILE